MKSRADDLYNFVDDYAMGLQVASVHCAIEATVHTTLVASVFGVFFWGVGGWGGREAEVKEWGSIVHNVF